MKRTNERMKLIGLYDLDSKIPNLALMKISAYHKEKGDHVEFYSPLFHSLYDKIYASKIFTFTDKKYLRDDMIRGGSGLDLHNSLPPEIEHIYPDYELYDCEYAIGFLTRGCIRQCNFCIVPEKEGKIHFNAHLDEFTRSQDKVMLLDNNFLAYNHHKELLHELIASERKIDFNQGLDIRLITKANAKLLRKVKRWDGYRYRFALDDPLLIPLVEKKLKILNSVGITNGILSFYVLIGFNTTKKQDLKRIKFLKKMKCSIFVMPYNKDNQYQSKFTRWVNRFCYKYETFENYQTQKN